jgi:cytochrome c nitrite reductase small subunit
MEHRASGGWRRAGGSSALGVVAAALVGSALGLGIFTFIYGEGASYLSDDPEACINCHVMSEQFDSWVKSSHSGFAVCNDCHLPEPAVPRWATKTDNGFFHSWAFTFDRFHEPIRIKPRNRRVVQRACVACHLDMVHELLPTTVAGEAIECYQCHADVGHALSR